MTESGNTIVENESIEKWFSEQNDNEFPRYSLAKGEISYKERYLRFKESLIPIHNSVERNAMAAGAVEWMEETKKIFSEIEDNAKRDEKLRQLEESDPVVHLNNHGVGHVDKVIEKLSEMLWSFERGYLTPYESFFLLCAIQIHDVGNNFGRENHERSLKRILDEKGQPHIPDSFERKLIEKLALVHGGTMEGMKNTIDYLEEKKTLYEKKLRKRLLAALLRFADELADDSSRADREGLSLGTILEGSLIYHRYSEALHTVKIEKNENEKLQVYLSYEIDSDLAGKKFKKNGKEKYLLDEIYDRTLKMERERRYCMRFIRPCLSLDCIRVEIVIQNTRDSFKREKIQYTLKENGYPSAPATGSILDFSSSIRCGSEQYQYLQREWSL
ncbi:MAG: hypothetical protein KQJ78_21165 [Deltaproteobacteria bacterium]|nr:hypothetical protein [Deltaproteobacteria bacterium]